MIKNSFDDYKTEVLRLIQLDLDEKVVEYNFEYEEDAHFGDELIIVRSYDNCSKFEIRIWKKIEAIKLFNRFRLINLDPSILSYSKSISGEIHVSMLGLLKEIIKTNQFKETSIYLDGISRELRFPHEFSTPKINWNVNSDYHELNEFVELIEKIVAKNEKS